MDVELVDIKQPDNNNDLEERRDEVCSENGSCSNHNTPVATEHSRLLSESHVGDSNGEHCIVGNIPGNIPVQPGQSPDKPVGNLGRLKRELNEQACCKLKVWMLLFIAFIFIILVIFLSVYFCTVQVEDMDEKYNTAEFVVPRLFRGNLSTRLVNKTFLQEKLSKIYTSSYALGRYFSLATVDEMSNSSVTYNLTFVMPEKHEQLTLYTLSKEMVYGVLVQELYDQDLDDPLYIEPTSLTMEVVS